jgi:hypothetical protein
MGVFTVYESHFSLAVHSVVRPAAEVDVAVEKCHFACPGNAVGVPGAGVDVPIREGHLSDAVFGVGLELAFVNVPVLNEGPKALRLQWFWVLAEVRYFLEDCLFAHWGVGFFEER